MTTPHNPAQPAVIYDEALVPAYTLPDPLDHGRIARSQQWPAQRSTILALFAEQVYGRTPRSAIAIDMTASATTRVFEGSATRQEVVLTFGTSANALRMTILIYLPVQQSPAPLFLGLNFDGNHTIHALLGFLFLVF